MDLLENYEKYEFEYIFRCQTMYVGSDIEFGLEDFTQDDYDDYLSYGDTYDQYLELAIDELGIEWEVDGDVLLIYCNNVEEEVNIEGYDYDNYDEMMDLAIDSIGLFFEIIENEEHPNYILKKNMKKYNL